VEPKSNFSKSCAKIHLWKRWSQKATFQKVAQKSTFGKGGAKKQLFKKLRKNPPLEKVEPKYTKIFISVNLIK
jgi:hypothetical protein